MPVFQYRAVSTTGEIIEGAMEAGSQKEAVDKLYALGHTPIRAQESSGVLSSGTGGSVLNLFRPKDKPTRKDIMEFTQQLATLLGAGLELDRALQVLLDVADKDVVKNMLTSMQERLHGGGSLSEAMEEQSGVFSGLYLNMVRAGEVAGAQDQILQRLADYLERAEELRNSVTSALIYPIILLVVALLSIFVLLTVVLPEFRQLFEDMGATLPLPTQIVISVGDFMNRYGWILILLLIAGGWLFKRKLAEPRFRYQWHAFLLRLPLFSDLLLKVEVARFSQTLGTLLANGVPMLSALGIVKDTLTNRVLVDSMDDLSDSLKHGGGMAKPLDDANLFPKQAVHLLKVGEETGKLEGMLLKIASIYDIEVHNAVKRLLALLEPLLILGLGVMVAGIILSILLAILGINDLPI